MAVFGESTQVHVCLTEEAELQPELWASSFIGWRLCPQRSVNFTVKVCSHCELHRVRVKQHTQTVKNGHKDQCDSCLRVQSWLFNNHTCSVNKLDRGLHDQVRTIRTYESVRMVRHRSNPTKCASCLTSTSGWRLEASMVDETQHLSATPSTFNTRFISKGSSNVVLWGPCSEEQKLLNRNVYLIRSIQGKSMMSCHLSFVFPQHCGLQRHSVHGRLQSNCFRLDNACVEHNTQNLADLRRPCMHSTVLLDQARMLSWFKALTVSDDSHIKACHKVFVCVTCSDA